MPGVHNQKDDLTLTQVLNYIYRCGLEDGMKFVFGPISEIDLENLHRNTYPLVYSEVTNVSLNKGHTIYTIDITVCDLDEGDIQGINESANTNTISFEQYSNRIFQLRNLLDFSKRMIGKLKHGGASSTAAGESVVPVFEYTIKTPINLTPFMASFSNQLIGYNFSLTVETEAGLNAINQISDNSGTMDEVVITNS